MKSHFRHNKEPKKYIGRFVLGHASSIILCCAALFMTGALLIPKYAMGFWPFTSPEEKYVARVGSEVVTTNEYLIAINELHKSSRLAEELDKGTSFEKQNYRKFLDELIDDKLMIVEAVNLSLDKGPQFVSAFNTYKMNLILNRLEQDEIKSKVSVEEQEIREYYSEQLHKDEKVVGEEKKDTTALEEKKDTATPEEKKDDALFFVPPTEKIPSKSETESIKATLMKKKTEAREKEYFAKLREKANVKIDSAILEDLSPDKPDVLDKAVAEVNGEAILGRSLLYQLRSSKVTDNLEERSKLLDKIILHKLLDQEALRRGYADEKDIQEKIKQHRDELLIDEFKKRVILPGISVTQDEIKEYYDNNKDKHYKEKDKVDLRAILVNDKEKAEEILAELRKGADFAYLAKKDSIDRSGAKGGDVGLTNVDEFPEEIRDAFQNAKRGDYLGPVSIAGFYAVLEFRSLEKGGYRPLDAVKVKIDSLLGQGKFKAQLTEYLKRLRDVVPIEINEKELNLIIEGK